MWHPHKKTEPGPLPPPSCFLHQLYINFKIQDGCLFFSFFLNSVQGVGGAAAAGGIGGAPYKRKENKKEKYSVQGVGGVAVGGIGGGPNKKNGVKKIIIKKYSVQGVGGAAAGGGDIGGVHFFFFFTLCKKL